MTPESVERTLIDVLGMKSFNLRGAPHELTTAEKPERAPDPPKLLNGLKSDTADGFVNITAADERRYYWSYNNSSQ
jgi:CubicO group peptidase (beta-lactamase class C family)